MPLKDTYLHTAITVWGVCWIRSPFGWIWILCSSIWLFRLQKRAVLISCILLIWMQFRITSPIDSTLPPASFTATIQEIKSSYALAQYEDETILLYDVNGVAFGDIVQVEAECTTIDGLKNFHQFSFSDWTKRRGITYGCSLKNQTMIEKSTSMRASIYERITSMESEPRNWLLKTLYGIQAEEEQEVSYMVSSSGMHMSFACTLLEKLLAICLPTVYCQILTIILIFLFGNVILWKDALYRIVCFRFANLLFAKQSAFDRLGIGMLWMLVLFPYTASEITFVLPVVFRLTFLFNVQKRSKRLVSMLVLLPLQFHYFNEVDMLQLFIFPLLRKGYGIAFLCALLYVCIPNSVVYMLAMWLLDCLQWLQSFHFPFYYAASIPFLFIWFYQGFKWLGKRSKKHSVLLVSLFLYTQIAPYLRPYMEVMMIDVGQGDATLISLPFHQGNILIDVAGNKHKNIPKDVIVPVLHARGIRSIDLVIITHDDFDHSGGLPQLEELMEVKQVITEKQEKITLGNTTFHFLLSSYSYEDSNNNSILTFFTAFDTNMLFMGDAGKEVEADLMREFVNLQADVLKVGHHGSKTSSSLSFLHQLHPSLALISCGANNFYGHPSKETLASLTQEDIQTLDTPHHGAVSIKLTNFIRFYKTATDEFGIIKVR